VVEGRSPSITLVLDGLQIGAWQWAFAKSTPRAASASMLGVCTTGWP